MEKAKILQTAKEPEKSVLEKSKSDLVPRKLTTTGMFADLEQKLQPNVGPPKLRKSSLPSLLLLTYSLARTT